MYVVLWLLCVLYDHTRATHNLKPLISMGAAAARRHFALLPNREDHLSNARILLII